MSLLIWALTSDNRAIQKKKELPIPNQSADEWSLFLSYPRNHVSSHDVQLWFAHWFKCHVSRHMPLLILRPIWSWISFGVPRQNVTVPSNFTLGYCVMFALLVDNGRYLLLFCLWWNGFRYVVQVTGVSGNRSPRFRTSEGQVEEICYRSFPLIIVAFRFYMRQPD